MVLSDTARERLDGIRVVESRGARSPAWSRPLAPEASAERHPPDAALVAAGLRGDQAAFGELVRRHGNLVVGFAYNRVGDFQLAEDLAQDTFIKAYNSLETLKEPNKFTSWLLVIARHTCMDWLRASKDAVSLEGLREAGYEPAPNTVARTLEQITEAELEARILQEIQELREDYREIIVMKHIDNLSYRQIGELLGMSVSAVGEKLSRIRQILRKRLADTVL